MITDLEKFNIRTGIDEEQQRVIICTSCPKNSFINNEHICTMCACPISYIITQKYKNCPLGNWKV